MKWVVGLIVIVGLGAGVFYWVAHNVSEPRVGLQLAFGEPQKDEMLLEIILSSGLTTTDPPGGDTRYNSAWQEWVDEHLELVDEAGRKVPLRYENQNALAVLGVSHGTPDVGFVRATVKPGQAYEVRYRAKASATNPFHARLRAPATASDAQLITLERSDTKH